MLIAMGVDGNNQILPLAFAIVENESYDTWDWFLFHVKNHVVKDCLTSDRHGGILKAVNEHGSPWLEPRGFHRYCLRHFINNFYDKFRNSELKSLAYHARSLNQIRKFNSIMEEIGKLNLDIGWKIIHLIDGHLHMIVEGDMGCSQQICQRFSPVYLKVRVFYQSQRVCNLHSIEWCIILR